MTWVLVGEISTGTGEGGGRLTSGEGDSLGLGSGSAPLGAGLGDSGSLGAEALGAADAGADSLACGSGGVTRAVGEEVAPPVQALPAKNNAPANATNARRSVSVGVAIKRSVALRG